MFVRASLCILTPHAHIFNRICLYCIRLLEGTLMMAVLRSKRIGGTSWSDKWLFVVHCAIVVLNSVYSVYCKEHGRH